MKCNLCEDKRLELFIITPENNYLKCSNCGLVQRENIPDSSNIKEIYDEEYFRERKSDGTGADFIGEERLYLSRFRDRIKRIEKKTEKGAILDIGASVGQFLYTARESGWEVYGIEISQSAVNIAKRKYGIEIQTGTIEDVNTKEKLFDVITMWHVFEHFPDPKQSLGMISSMLRDRGLLVIELPNIGSEEAIKAGEKWSFLRPKEHLYHYTPETITMFLNDAGFKVEEIEYEGGGTGIGERIEGMGMGRIKGFIIKIFPFAMWLKALFLTLSKAKGSRDIMIVFSKKQERDAKT